MPLIVHAARLSLKDPDVLDITRSGALKALREHKPEPFGACFAPSEELLRPALEQREKARLAKREGATDVAKRLEDEAWASYVPKYIAEMKHSYTTRRLQWKSLLARERVVLVCFCGEAAHCHRTILGETILPKLGAEWRGELSPALERAAKNPPLPGF